MITHISGKLIEKNPSNVVIECNGLGYYLPISLQTFSKIPDNEQVKLYTYLNIRDDAHILFGFADKTEREIFKFLISVSGVGPSIAITMLSSMDTKEIQQAIASGDVEKIKSVKGIGIKTAQRVIVDLKDKILKTYELSEDIAVTNNTIKNEALSALEVLGFSRKKVESAIQVILQDSPDISLEELIKKALKNL
ncbi:MAG: Holliday junction branch migration protein RuvA [Flavobacteriaceae bacterium]|nr:Holliday junction branch migration protein RuvA [Flavobacteriaceae bacterium]